MVAFVVVIICGLFGIVASVQVYRKEKAALPMTVMITVLMFWLAFEGITVHRRIYIPENVNVTLFDDTVIVSNEDFSETFNTISALRKLTTDSDKYVVKIREGRNILKGVMYKLVIIDNKG